MNEHARIEEAIAAAVVDPEARAANGTDVFDHLASCGSCQRLYRELREVAGDLSLAVTPIAPSVAVEERIMTAIRGDDAARTIPRPRRGARARILLAAAIAAVAALGGLNLKVASDLRDARAEVRALAVVASPDATVVRLEERDGPGVVTVGVLADGRAALVGSGLQVPDGRVFELWIQRGTTMIPAAIFTPRDGRAALAFTVDVARDVAVAITVEERLEPAPTTEPVFIGSIV